LRLPTAEPLVYQLDWKAQVLFDARREPRGFGRHLARAAIEMQRAADNDALDAVPAHEFA